MKPFKFKAEIVPGKCPTCEEHTLLVGLTKEYFHTMLLIFLFVQG